MIDLAGIQKSGHVKRVYTSSRYFYWLSGRLNSKIAEDSSGLIFSLSCNYRFICEHAKSIVFANELAHHNKLICIGKYNRNKKAVTLLNHKQRQP